MAVKLVIYGSDNLLKKDVVKICNDNSDQFITGICFMMVMLWPEFSLKRTDLFCIRLWIVFVLFLVACHT